MNRDKFVSPFPRFRLSDTDTTQLHALAASFTASSLAQYEAFTQTLDARRARGDTAVDTNVWRFLRERDNLRAYTGRPSSTHTSAPCTDTTALTPSSNSDERASTSLRRSSTVVADACHLVAPPPLASPTPSSTSSTSSTSSKASTKAHSQQHRNSSNREPPLDDMSVVLVLGDVAGSIDDLMLGMLSDTVDAARIKSSYVDDMESDVAVLATLTAPTAARPFDSITIKWATLQSPRVVRALVKKRDVVYMELTGTTTLGRGGERVGYHLMHSLHFPQTPELASCVRANLSIATFCRARPRQSVAANRCEVELCVQGVADLRGSMLRSVTVANLANRLTSLWRSVECATAKKLLHALARAHHASLAATSTATALTAATSRRSDDDLDVFHDAIDSSSSDDDVILRTFQRQQQPHRAAHRVAQCTTCRRIPTRASHACALCCASVCSSCRVKKGLRHLDAATGALHERSLSFCVACLRRANATSAYSVAQFDAASRATSAAAALEAGAAGNGTGSGSRRWKQHKDAWFVRTGGDCGDDRESDVLETPTSAWSWFDTV